MKRTTFVLRLSLVLLVCLGTFGAVGPAANARNRCKDRCNDAYQLKKDACKLIPLKGERHLCEKRVKRSKDDCKHNCR
jgi:hypothetical protein